MLSIPLAAAVLGGCQEQSGQAVPGTKLARQAKSARQGLKAGELANRSVMNKGATAAAAKMAKGQRLGTLEIPRLGIKEWLVHGTEKEDLVLGAGHIEGTSLPGMGRNFGVAGDRVLYSAPLLRADQMVKGDEVFVETGYGSFVYTVESLQTVTPEQTQVLLPKGYDSITLVTCDPSWQMYTRLVISARATSEEPRL
ncbi:MAG: class E sortase [Pseudomonadota bacterium]